MWRLRALLFGCRRVIVYDRLESFAKILMVREDVGGLFVNWHGLSYTWFKLYPDGTVRGYNETRFTWEPVSGWTNEELSQLAIPHRMIES